MNSEDRLKRLFAASPEQMEAIDCILELGIPKKTYDNVWPLAHGNVSFRKAAWSQPRHPLADDQSRHTSKD